MSVTRRAKGVVRLRESVRRCAGREGWWVRLFWR